MLRRWTINDLLEWSTKAVKLHVDFMLLNGPC